MPSQTIGLSRSSSQWYETKVPAAQAKRPGVLELEPHLLDRAGLRGNLREDAEADGEGAFGHGWLA